MRVLMIGGFIGAGAVLLTAWVLALAGRLAVIGDPGRELNVVLFLAGTFLLAIGVVIAVSTLRAERAGRQGISRRPTLTSQTQADSSGASRS